MQEPARGTRLPAVAGYPDVKRVGRFHMVLAARFELALSGV